MSDEYISIITSDIVPVSTTMLNQRVCFVQSHEEITKYQNEEVAKPDDDGADEKATIVKVFKINSLPEYITKFGNKTPFTAQFIKTFFSQDQQGQYIYVAHSVNTSRKLSDNVTDALTYIQNNNLPLPYMLSTTKYLFNEDLFDFVGVCITFTVKNGGIVIVTGNKDSNISSEDNFQNQRVIYILGNTSVKDDTNKDQVTNTMYPSSAFMSYISGEPHPYVLSLIGNASLQNVTPSNIGWLAAKGGNINIIDKKGNTLVVSPGIDTKGTQIHRTLKKDHIVRELKTALMNLSLSKYGVPMNQYGINLVKTTIASVLLAYKKLDDNDNDPEKFLSNIVIKSPSVGDITPERKSNFEMPPFAVSATIADYAISFILNISFSN